MKVVYALLPLVAVVISTPLQGRITNGMSASLGQFPYQVGLSMRLNAISSSWCSGSLIASEWVLTAAHCTNGIYSLTIYLGATNRTSAEVAHHVNKNNIVIHSNFNATTLRDDISLIRIPTTEYTDKIQPIKLPTTIDDTASSYVGAKVLVSGWGRLSDSARKVAEQLQWARLDVLPNDNCSQIYGTSVVYPTNICVKAVGGASTCNGDSGGPLVLESTGVQVGLVSFGAADGCEKNFPIAFTRLSSYLKWIEINTNMTFR